MPDRSRDWFVGLRASLTDDSVLGVPSQRRGIRPFHKVEAGVEQARGGQKCSFWGFVRCGHRLATIWLGTPSKHIRSSLLEIILAEAARIMLERFDMPLALVVFDTLSSSAGFKNADDTAENQRVMDVLKALSLRFDCLVLAVDHFGKNAESGTRNSSVKEDSVDAFLALIGERDAAGTISNPRMAIRKVRGGPTGGEIRFTPRVAQIGEDGAETTIVIDWPEQEPSSATAASGWRRDGLQLRVALEKALGRSGRSR